MSNYDEFEDDDEPCPACGNPTTRRQRCTVVGCDDGWIDMHEHDDPLLFDPGEMEMCQECHGTGNLWWCPKCGLDMHLRHLPRMTVQEWRERECEAKRQ
jgi:predicted RNA-binding Zn-ribbon protein involved in translation (DUF1610 family)